MPRHIDADCVGRSGDSLSGLTVQLLIFSFTGALAGVTILTHVAQLAGIAFRSYALAAVAIGIAAPVLCCTLSPPQFARMRVRDPKVLLLVLILGACGASLASVANRVALDDFYYVPNAVYYLHNPNALMDFDIHYLYSAGARFTSQVWATAGPYEYAEAALAYLLGTEFLVIYHVMGPAVGGFLLALALYLAVLHFSDDTLAAAVGTLVTMGVIMLLGDTERTVGSFSLARIFEGKVVLLAVGIPMWIAVTLNYLRGPTFVGWIMCLSVATALIGMSSSAAIVLPSLAVVLAAAHVLTTEDRAQGFWHALVYLLSLVYVAVYALFLLTHAVTDLGVASPANWRFPKTFLGHARFFVNARVPLTPALVIGSTALCLIVVSTRTRRLLLGWIGAAVVLFLNPIVAPALIEHITSPNAYWRLFYILPFPLVVGIASSVAFARTAQWSAQRRFAAVALVSVLWVCAKGLLPTA